MFEGSQRSCAEHGIDHEVLSGRELGRRFPGYRLPPDHLALLQPEGGFLLPERCITAHAEGAARRGAELRAPERVLEWHPDGDGVRVTTDHDSYRAGHLLLTAGAWAAALEPVLGGLAVPERQVLAWFEPARPELFTPPHFPVFNLLVDEGRYYGFPVFGVPGFKVGRYHHLEERVDPDTLERTCGSADERILRDFAERYFPDAAGPTLDLRVCMFTNSPDEHFIVDRHPEHPGVTIAAGFSGHGYKFCSVIGEILADLATEGTTRHDISRFRLDRFATTRA